MVAGAVVAHPTVRYVSLAIAIAVATSTMVRNITKVAASTVETRYPRGYAPRTWLDTFKYTWAHVRAAAPPSSAPCALLFWIASWAAHGLVMFYLTRVAFWTLITLCMMVSRTSNTVMHMRAMSKGKFGGSGLSSIIEDTVARVTPMLSHRVDSGTIKKMASRVLSSNNTNMPSMVTTLTSGMHMFGKHGIVSNAARLLFWPLMSIVADAKSETKRDALACIKLVSWCAPVFVGGAAVSALRKSTGAKNTKGKAALNMHPVDPLVGALRPNT